MPNAETLLAIAEVLHVDLDTLFGRSSSKSSDTTLIKDVRLFERMKELEKLDRRFRDTAVAVLEALILQGHEESIKARLTGTSRSAEVS